MHITQQQEQFSNAYLRMVATVAECTLSKPDVDDDSIDFSIKTKGYSGPFSRPVLDIQLKCHKNFAIDSEKFTYPLKIKNFDDLRVTDALVPRILIVLIVPNRVDDWLEQSDKQTIVKHCAYWASVRGEPPTKNTHSVTVPILQANRLTPNEVRRLMQIVASGGAP
jgi:hypothetical protein